MGEAGKATGPRLPGIAGLPKHLPAGRQERNFAKPVAYILSHGFFIDGNIKF